MRAFDIQSIKQGGALLEDYCFDLLQALSQSNSQPDLKTYIRPHVNALGLLLYATPDFSDDAFISLLHAHMNSASADTGILVEDEVLRRHRIPSLNAVPDNLWPMIETSAFQSSQLVQAFNELVVKYLRRHLPGFHTIPAINLAPEFWWTLIALFSNPDAEKQPAVMRSCFSDWLDWFRRVFGFRRKSKIPAEPPDVRPEQYERRMIEIAFTRAFADEMRWATFWEQWGLLFILHRAHEKSLNADVESRIISLPLAQTVFPHTSHDGQIKPKSRAIVSADWETTIPEWFRKYNNNWLRLS